MEQGVTETMLGKSDIRIMDAETGDLKMEWNRDRPEEIAPAQEAFEKARKKGMVFYKMKYDGTKGEVIKDFDPNAERIIGIPFVVGG